MLGNHNYNGSIRDITVAVGSLFNNLHVYRNNADDTLAKDIKVALGYESRAGYWAKLKEGQARDNVADFEKILPRMTYYMMGIEYDAQRQLHALNQTISANPSATTGNSLTQHSPVPYNLNYNVSIFTKNVEDGLELLEQILPVFNPLYMINMKDPSGLGVVEDVPLILNSVDSEDNYQEAFEGNRIVSWTLSLTARTNLYPQIADQPVIQQAVVQTATDPAIANVIKTATTTPAGTTLVP